MAEPQSARVYCASGKCFQEYVCTQCSESRPSQQPVSPQLVSLRTESTESAGLASTPSAYDPPKRKGFAAITPERRSAIAAMGGRAAQAKGTAHRYTPEEGKAAGIKSGALRTASAKPKVKKVRVYKKGAANPQFVPDPTDTMLIDALKGGQ